MLRNHDISEETSIQLARMENIQRKMHLLNMPEADRTAMIGQTTSFLQILQQRYGFSKKRSADFTRSGSYGKYFADKTPFRKRREERRQKLMQIIWNLSEEPKISEKVAHAAKVRLHHCIKDEVLAQCWNQLSQRWPLGSIGSNIKLSVVGPGLETQSSRLPLQRSFSLGFLIRLPDSAPDHLVAQIL